MEKKWKGKHRLITILAMTAILVGEMGFAVPGITQGSMRAEAATDTEVLEVYHGKMAITDGTYYYYKSGKVGDTNTLVRRKTGDEEAKEEIIGKVSEEDFYICGNYVYYTLSDGIYRMKKNGKSKNRIYKGAANIINVYNGYVYFYRRDKNLDKDGLKGFVIQRVSLGGKVTKVLTTFSSYVSNPDVVMGDERIYYRYVDGSTVSYKSGYMCTTDLYDLAYVTLGGKNTKQILSDVYIGDLFADENGVYFTYSDNIQEEDTVSLQKWSKKSGLEEFLTIDGRHEYTQLKAICDGKLYFVTLYSPNDDRGYDEFGTKLYEFNIEDETCENIANLMALMRGNVDLVPDLTVNHKWILFSLKSEDNGTLWFYRNLGEEEFTQISTSFYIKSPIELIGSQLYYIQRMQINKYQYEMTYQKLKLNE